MRQMGLFLSGFWGIVSFRTDEPYEGILHVRVCGGGGWKQLPLPAPDSVLLRYAPQNRTAELIVMVRHEVALFSVFNEL
jgi:hypothetical protein